jgi:hypothetical protein
MYIYTHSSQYRDAGLGKRNKKIGTAVNAACQGDLSACHRFANPVLEQQNSINLFLGNINNLVPKYYIHKYFHLLVVLE